MSDLRSRIGRFLDMEARRRLFDFQVDGWSIWRVIRQPVHRVALDLPIGGPGGHRRGKPRFMLQSMRLLYFILFGPRSDLFVSASQADLRADIGGKRADVFFDELLKGRRYFKVEHWNAASLIEPSEMACPAHLQANVIELWGRILGRLAPVTAAYGALDDIAAVLSAEMGLDVEVTELQRGISSIFWKIRIYSLLLKRTKARLVMVSDSGEYALLLAAAKVGVPSLEVQHGFTYSGHPDVIPLTAGLPRKALATPDLLAARGAFWIDCLKGSYQGEAAVTVGLQGIDDARVLRASQARKDRPFTIVLTSQGLDSERLVAWVAEMVKAAPPELSWRLLVKPHPLYDRGNTLLDDMARDEHVSVSDGPGAPTALELLSEADLHLSIASSCLFDAAALGVASVVIPLSGHEEVVDYVDGEMLFLATQPADVWNHLDATIPASGRDRYCEPAYIDNMQGLIDRMTQGDARGAP